MISSGNTFERSALLQFYDQEGHIDPITGNLVDANFLEANNHLKKSIESYV